MVHLLWKVAEMRKRRSAVVYSTLQVWCLLCLSFSGVTRRAHAVSMNISPSLTFVANCPRRYHLERNLKQKTLAPFASSVIGQLVHKRIARSLKTATQADMSELELPKRLLLHEDQDLSHLLQRAQDALTYFNNKCLPYLQNHQVILIEHRIKESYILNNQTFTLTGVIDCIIQTSDAEHIIDWKTGSAERATDQLRFYLMLRQLETKQAPKSAEAISLSERNSHNERATDDLPNWFNGYLTDLLRHLEASQPQEARSGKHCQYCPYAHTCETSKAPKRYLLDTWTGKVAQLDGVQM